MDRKEEVKRITDEARRLIDRAKAEGRPLSADEMRRVSNATDEARKLNDDDEANASMTEQIDRLRHGAPKYPDKGGLAKGGLAKVVMDAGFGLKSQPAIELPSSAVFNSTLPGADTWEIRGPGIAPLGRDTRFLYVNLPTENAEDASAVSDFKQGARSLTGNAVRELDATTDKAALDVTLTSVVVKLEK